MPNSHRPRVETDLNALRKSTLDMATQSEAILDKSLEALRTLDVSLAAAVQKDDLELDRLDVEIDDRVLHMLALDAPVASDLRLVVAIKSIATNLERVGDLARNIASCATRLAARPPIPIPDALRELTEAGPAILKDAIRAFVELDPSQARAVLDDDDAIDSLEDQMIRAAITRIAEMPEHAEQELDLIFIAQNLERIGDHATNIAEEVILAAEARILKHASKLRS